MHSFIRYIPLHKYSIKWYLLPDIKMYSQLLLSDKTDLSQLNFSVIYKKKLTKIRNLPPIAK